MAAEPKQTPPVPTPPATPSLSLDDIKAAVRDVLAESTAPSAEDIKAAVREALAEMPLGEINNAGDPVTFDVDAPTEKRTIRHNLFSYDVPGGGNAIAMRGETVSLLPHDVERGERNGAFTALIGHLPEPQGSVLPTFPVDGDSAAAEQDAWVKAGTVEEIVTAANAQPEAVAMMIEAETRRGPAARKSLLAALAAMEVRG